MNMTARKMMKTLKQAGVETQHIQIDDQDSIEVWTGDAESSETLKQRVISILKVGGFKTGYGSWILREDYQSPGDWNDKASRWHY
jgi:hypothetical protein